MDLPSKDVQRALVQSFALCVSRLDLLAEPRPVVLPNGEFFPDVFTGDRASVQRMLERMLSHAGLSDMAFEVNFWGEQADASCGTGACGSCGPVEAETEGVERLVDAGEHWQVNVLPAETRDPVPLGCALGRAIALALILEAAAPPHEMPLDLAVDLTAVGLGFGVLLLEGSHIYRKSCGGPSIGRVTALGPTELALVTALAAAVHAQPVRKVGKYLSPTQVEAFDEAKAWADSNAALVSLVQRDPARAAQGELEIHESKSWLGRFLGGKSRHAPSAENATTIEELEAALGAGAARRLPAPAKAKDPKLEEIRRLVDEALSE